MKFMEILLINISHTAFEIEQQKGQKWLPPVIFWLSSYKRLYKAQKFYIKDEKNVQIHPPREWIIYIIKRKLAKMNRVRDEIN